MTGADRTEGIEMTGGLPSLQHEKITQLVESGFEPLKCRFLADEIFGMVRNLLSLKMKNFKIPCPRAVQLMGGADQTGTVEPGQVHINFSRAFVDSATGQPFLSWAGMECLVGRNPARRRSDIRKLRVVCKPGLEHVRDVALFSTKGMQPEASKMQGGDYDGDTFWICVEPKLVEPFKNAPAPSVSDPPHPSELFIEKDERKFRDIVTVPAEGEAFNEDELRRWIAINTAKRLEFNYLGTVTRLHEDVTYHQNSLDSPQADALNALCDHIIDAPKQCFSFDGLALQKVKKKYNIPKFEKPAHRKYTSLEEADQDVPREWNKNSIVDQVFFGVLEKECHSAVESLRTLLSKATIQDDDLTGPYNKMMEEASNDSTVYKELKCLPTQLAKVKDAWSLAMSKYGQTKSKTVYMEGLNQCRAVYESIRPLNEADVAIQQWLRPLGNETVTFRDHVKASAFATRYSTYDSYSKMLFNVAGDMLCRLKAPVMGPTRTLTMSSYGLLKPGKFNAFATVADPEDDDDADRENVDDDDEYPIDDRVFKDIDHTTPSKGKRKHSASDEDQVARQAASNPFLRER